MAGARSLLVVAVVSALVGAGLTLLLISPVGPPGDAALRTPAAPQGGERAQSAQPQAGEVGSAPVDPLAGLSTTPDERAFLQKALEAERARREAERQRREQAVIAPADGGLDIFRRWQEDGANVGPVVKDYAAMKARIRTGDGPVHRIEATGDVTPVKLGALTGDSAVIEFGVGRFVLDTGGSQWGTIEKVVRSLEIRGAGMDKTSLVIKGWAFVFVSGKLENLFLHDLSLDFANKTQPFDIRGKASMALEKVRISNWEIAGHAAPFGVSGGAFLACRGCDFVGRGEGFVLSLRGPAIATFDDCRFSDVGATFIGGGSAGSGPPSVVRVRNCTFQNAPLADSRIGGGGSGGVGGGGKGGGGSNGGSSPESVDLVVEGGRVEMGTARMTDDERRKVWGAEYARSVEGVSFGPGKARFTVDDLLLTLEFAERQGIAPLIRVDAGAGTRSSGIEIEFYTIDRQSGKLVRTTKRFTESGLTDVARDPRRGSRGMPGTDIRSAADLGGYLPMAQAIRASGIAGDEPVTNAEMGRVVPTKEAKTRILQLWGSGLRPIGIDARTGKLLYGR